MVAQTSNEHLDELNARAQAIRLQHKQLGDDSIPIPGRPYRLHAGDHIQVRHTIHDSHYGPLRNGTTAHIAAVDGGTGELELELADGRKLRLGEQQVVAGDIRLAYVQHPFLAQGQTTDTAHLLVAEHATREGSYVGLTRARHATNIYAAEAPDQDSEQEPDRLQGLATRMNRTEPEVPSIRTPLAHESAITADVAHDDRWRSRSSGPIRCQPTARCGYSYRRALGLRRGAITEPFGEGRSDLDQFSASPAAVIKPVVVVEHDDASNRSEREGQERVRRMWPPRRDHEPPFPQRTADQLERDDSPGWEP